MSEGAAAVEAAAAAQGAPAEAPPAGTDWDSAANEIMGLPEGSRLAGDAGSIVAQPRPTPEPEQPAEAQTPEAKPGEQAKAEEPEPEKIERDESLMPREVLQALKTLPDRRTAQALRDSWFKGRAFEQIFPTVRQAREAAETVAMFGSPDEARGMAEQALRMANLDGILRDGDEGAREQLMGEIFQNVGPERFASLATDVLATWAHADPQRFDEVVSEVAELRGYRKAAAPAEEPLDEYGEPRRPTEAETKRAAELDARQAQLEEREAAMQARARDAAENAMVETIAGPFVGQLGAMVAKALPGMSEDGRARVVGEILNRWMAKEDGNPAWHAGLERARLEGPQAARQFFLSRAIPAVGPIARQVIERVSKDVLAYNAAKMRTKTAAAEKREPVGGGAPERPQGRTRPPGLDYSRTSDRDILDRG